MAAIATNGTTPRTKLIQKKVRRGRGDNMVPGTKGKWSGEDRGSDQVVKPQEGVWQAPLNPLSGGKPDEERWRRGEVVVGYQPTDR